MKDPKISRCWVDNDKRFVIMYGERGQIIHSMSFDTLAMFCSYKFQREMKEYRKRMEL